MTFDDKKNQVLDILKLHLEKMEIEIFEIKLFKNGNTDIIDIAADKKNGGITIDECAEINVFLNRNLEASGIFDDYSIQVSSPGLDRPLKEKKDFLRVIDKEVQVYLLEQYEGRVQYDGILKEVKDEGIILNVKQNLVDIPFHKINKGMQVF